MNNLLRIGALCALFGLSGCYIPEVRPEKMATIEVKKSTYDDVIKAYGLPSSELMLAGGTKVLLYHRTQFERTFEQNIPWYNLFYNDYHTGTYDYFFFNREGVLQSYSVPHFANEAKVDNPGS